MNTTTTTTRKEMRTIFETLILKPPILLDLYEEEEIEEENYDENYTRTPEEIQELEELMKWDEENMRQLEQDELRLTQL